MSDTTGERPENDNVDPAPASDPVSASEPLSGAAESVPPAPPAPPAPPTGPWAAPADGAPARPGPPSGYPAGAAYAPPAGWTAPGAAHAAGQTAPAGAHSAFGHAADHPADPHAHHTQPTVPLDDGAPAAPAARERKTGAGKVAALLVAAALVGGTAGLGGAYAGVTLFSTSASAPASGPATVTVNDDDSVTQTTAIAAKVVPSVVTIAASGGSGSGTGSGVVLSSDGYVVTNTHVVTLDGATGDAAIRVTTSDGAVYDAEVVGTDPTYDLAVIKLKDAEGLTPIEFGDSGSLNVGDETVAVGAPLGLANTVTTGIVSALNRSIEIASAAAPDNGGGEDGGGDGSQEQTPPFFFDFGQGHQGAQSSESIKIAVIQTDAAINPGNSGGALVDAAGELIGINVAIASAGGSSGQAGSIGVGFAIPSTIVQRITDEIIETGSATHGLLGASVQSAAYVEGTSITGAYIAELTQGGAAAEGGLQVGDIVTGFNGIPITDSVDLTAQVRAAAAGSDATVTYVRDGRTLEAEVTLGELAG